MLRPANDLGNPLSAFNQQILDSGDHNTPFHIAFVITSSGSFTTMMQPRGGQCTLCRTRKRMSNVMRLLSPPARRWIGKVHGSLFSSQADDGSTVASTEFLKSKAKRQDPLALFPWRHEASIPPRLQERGRSFQHDWVSYEWSTYYVSTLTGKVYLDLPLLTSFGQGWRKDLAESCAWAFSEGVNEIIGNVYHGEYDHI